VGEVIARRPEVLMQVRFVMSKVAGFALILAGVSVGVFAIAPSDNFVEQSQEVNSPTSGPVVSGAMLTPELVRAPRSPVAEASRFSSPVVATVAPHIGKLRILAIPKDRDALTRELQKELRRVGCYEGDISGTWSQSTRRAMKTFIERMNARLPIEEPDAVLYALLKAQDQPVCGKACSAGEVQSADGRCIPSVLLAHIKSKAAPSAAVVEKPSVAMVAGSVGTTPQSTEPSLEGRMRLAGPSSGPTAETATQTPRDRATRAVTSASQPRVGQNARRWSTAIFSSKLSNN
jgi:hypothetical protein